MQEKIATLLSKIERQNEEEISWIVGPQTGRMLYYFVRIWHPEIILEIGTSIGYSAIWMATALEEIGYGEIITIESHDRRFALAEANIKASGLQARIKQVKGHAPEVIDGKIPQIDMAFFDATKQETQSFFDAVFPRMVRGGLVVVDNVRSHRFKSMLAFIEKIHSDPRVEVVEIDVGAGLLLAVKK